MISDAINTILELAEPSIITLGDLQYSDKRLEPVPDPRPEPVTINTLTGIIDYIRHNKDGLDLTKLMIHVGDVRNVSLISNINGAFLGRNIHMKASYPDPCFGFGNFMDVETFIIAMQANFEDQGDRAAILSFVANLTQAVSSEFTDDGTSQQVTVKAGVSTVAKVTVPNPVNLTPYRTFYEAKQPESKFVFRLRRGSNGEPPKCALFEADGGRWKAEAMRNVKEWIEAALLKIGADIPVIE